MSAEEVEVFVEVSLAARTTNRRLSLPPLQPSSGPHVLAVLVVEQKPNTAPVPCIIVRNMDAIERVATRLESFKYYVTYEGQEYRVYWSADFEAEYNAAS